MLLSLASDRVFIPKIFLTEFAGILYQEAKIGQIILAVEEAAFPLTIC